MVGFEDVDSDVGLAGGRRRREPDELSAKGTCGMPLADARLVAREEIDFCSRGG